MKLFTPVSRCKHHAFSLVELLTVISVIAILSAILLTSIGYIRQNAGESVSRSNLRQLGSAMLMYSSENEGKLPPAGMWDPATQTGTSWDGVLFRAGIMDRPDVQKVIYNHLHESNNRTNADQYSPRSYSMVRAHNGTTRGVGMSRFDGNAPEAMRVGTIEQPNKTLMLVENFHPSNSMDSAGFCVIDTPQEQIDRAPERKLFNYLFVDAHVEALAPEETVGDGTLENPDGYWTVAAYD